MTTDPSNPSDWFLLAKDRLEKADALFVQLGAPWSGVELLHESVERYLKRYLIGCGWRLVKTHDLNHLLALSCGFNTAFAGFSPTCQSLTEQFWEQHYPGGDLDEVGGDYATLRDAVGSMVSLITPIMPLADPSLAARYSEPMASAGIHEEVLRDPLHPVSRIADQLLPYLKVLVEQFHPEQVILFGSYANGVPDKHSDVDLLIVKNIEKSSVSEKRDILRAWRPLRWAHTPIPFELLVVSPSEHLERLAQGGGFYSAIIKQGIQLA